MRILSSLVCVPVLGMMVANGFAGDRTSRYNVVWESPSVDHSGQMPFGNGDIAAGVCAIEDGDLYLLLAKNDAFNYNGDIYKTGRVKVSLDPNPFAAGKPFRQTLDLKTGSVRIEADGVEMRIWANALSPVYHVEINSPTDIAVTATPDLWERFDDCNHNVSREPIAEPTQDVLLEKDGRILWYFAVGDRSVFPTEMKFYDVEHLLGTHPDPYRHHTFGNLMECAMMDLEDGTLTGRGKSFDLRIHALAKQAPKVEDWIAAIEAQATAPLRATSAWEVHCRWWADFWDRSWITVSDNTLPEDVREKLSGEGYTSQRSDKDAGALVGQGYNVFRYLMACQSRGRIQTKFNGGLFTQPLRCEKKPRYNSTQINDRLWMSHEDARDWGRRFTYQNQRLLYWPLLMSGDGDMMQPFFRYYSDLLPVRKAITKAWFGHDGAYYRENIEPTGGERDCGRDGKPPKTKPGENKGDGYYHSYYFTSGLETTAMMIEYVKHTGDMQFRDRVLVPFAREVLLFFDKHYERDTDGMLRIDPGMVLETWWVAVNAAPDVAGLLHCLDELLAMDGGTQTDVAEWRRFRGEVPEVHLHEIAGRTAIAPAAEWSKRKNSENGLLYPVFPFRRFGVGMGTEDIAEWTMQHRTNKDAFGHKCWTQDQIHWAYAGNAAEAQDGLVHRYRHASPQCRFPLYGSAKPDSCPDFDHFGSGSSALQRMLVQEAAGKIHLLPAWPDNWDADFKLHVSGKSVISGSVKDGKLTDWSIEPASRRKDVVVHAPQKMPERALIPVSKHPVRVGRDQAGGNKFTGSIGRVTMIRGALKQDEVAVLAKGTREKKLSASSVIGSLLDPKVGDVLPCETSDLAKAVSFEAWLLPGTNETGRILDNLTPGVRDGFLLDCHPGLSLRVIVGPEQIIHKGVLTPGEWQHVVLTIEKGAIRTFLNGKNL